MASVEAGEAATAPAPDDGATPCYVGRKACGCVVAVTVNRPECREQVAKDIAGWIRDGLSVENVTLAEARRILRFCKCGEKGVARG